MKVIGIIPSRYNSTRFPGKPLVDINGKSMIQRVYEQCIKSSRLDEVVVATDDNRILSHVKQFGGKVIMTSSIHTTGTERCSEASKKLSNEYSIIVNIQGDEPLINPLQIDELLMLFNDENTQIGTLANKIDDLAELKNKNSPKAIFDDEGYATNFCRVIKSTKKNISYYKHIGLYAYRRDILNTICIIPQSKNEIEEKLEQLRWLDNNYKIKVGKTLYKSYSVDIPEDIEKIKLQLI